ncbi:cold shock domain-containing protein E1-like, partial [Geospiza fortis]|uniref:Cold shock domain-containing protein E1-like n=1 Tax=Geospiza fortis TaxID=48883 RepID=A0A8N5F5G1_GEOFO
MIEVMEDGEMKGEVYPFGIVGMANKGDCLQKGETVKFQLCVLGQNGQTMAVNITPFRRATVECVKDQVSDPGTRAWGWEITAPAGTEQLRTTSALELRELCPNRLLRTPALGSDV